MKFYLPEEYQIRCQQYFEIYQRMINKVLPNAKIEHIGASSIPDLISKGDLDIYVEVAQNEMMNAIQKLKPLGFNEKSNTLRTEQLCMLEHVTGQCAIQLVAAESEFEFFLYFRDALKKSKNLREQYNQLKRESVGLDGDEYRERKAIFIESVLNGTAI